MLCLQRFNVLNGLAGGLRSRKGGRRGRGRCEVVFIHADVEGRNHPLEVGAVKLIAEGHVMVSDRGQNAGHLFAVQNSSINRNCQYPIVQCNADVMSRHIADMRPRRLKPHFGAICGEGPEHELALGIGCQDKAVVQAYQFACGGRGIRGQRQGNGKIVLPQDVRHIFAINADNVGDIPQRYAFGIVRARRVECNFRSICIGKKSFGRGIGQHIRPGHSHDQTVFTCAPVGQGQSEGNLIGSPGHISMIDLDSSRNRAIPKIPGELCAFGKVAHVDRTERRVKMIEGGVVFHVAYMKFGRKLGCSDGRKGGCSADLQRVKQPSFYRAKVVETVL